MTDPTPVPGKDPSQPPPPPATKRSDEARRRREPKRSKRVFVVLTVAAAAFAGLAAWIMSQPLPYVTHREILDLAMAIERTKNADQLRQLFDPEFFRGLDRDEVERAWHWQDDPAVHLTFLTSVDGRTQRPRLLFRLQSQKPGKAGSTTTLIDFHEMVAGRLADGVKVVDFRSLMANDIWFRSAAAGPAGSGTPEGLAPLTGARTQSEAVAAFQALSAERRAEQLTRIALLKFADPRDRDGFAVLTREVRAWVPENLSPAFRLLYHAQFAETPLDEAGKDEVRAAIGRIQLRIPDPHNWLGAFFRALTKNDPPPRDDPEQPR